MRKISQKHKGFTLLEVIISMALIGILSIGVYNAYLMLIRHTKDGEIKQETALIGKKIVEEVKSGQRFYNDTSSEISIRDMNYVALDFKYYGIAESIVVEVENASKKQLNLYILNSIKKSDGDWNVDIDNKLGVLTECRRSDNDGKSGTLYDVKVTVSGKNSKGINEDKLFETGFVENVNTP